MERTRPGGRRRGLVSLLPALAAIAIVACSWLPQAASAAPTKLQFLRNATSSFDPYINSPSPQRAKFMRKHFAQMRGYAPHFDDAAFTTWTPSPTSFYKDLFAIYHPSEDATADAHPDWVLRDASGRPLFLPSGCGSGSCPQYAADPGNADWRDQWIAAAAETFQHSKEVSIDGIGYRGLFVDDVNLEMNLVTADGQSATPIDPRTGQPMTKSAWQGYIVTFLGQIRAAFPHAEIAHNSIWSLSQHDPNVVREVRSANFVELERGFNDAGLTAGNGKYSYRRFIRHIGWLHRLGASIILEPYLSSKRQARYEVANYFIVRKRKDAIASDFRANPGNWWRGWSTNLGRARGRGHFVARRHLLRRNYHRGSAIVNPPGGGTKTVRFRRPRRNLEGRRARKFHLADATGDVFIRTRRR